MRLTATNHLHPDQSHERLHTSQRTNTTSSHEPQCCSETVTGDAQIALASESHLAGVTGCDINKPVQILDLARIEEGYLSLSIEKVFLRDIVNECNTLIAPLAEQKEISIIEECHFEPPSEEDISKIVLRHTDSLKNMIFYPRMTKHESIVRPYYSVPTEFLNFEKGSLYVLKIV